MADAVADSQALMRLKAGTVVAICNPESVRYDEAVAIVTEEAPYVNIGIASLVQVMSVTYARPTLLHECEVSSLPMVRYMFPHESPAFLNSDD